MIIVDIFKINFDIDNFEGNMDAEHNKNSLNVWDNIVKNAENL